MIENYPEVPIFNWLEIETQGSCNRTCKTCLRQTYINPENSTHKGRFPVSSKVGGGSKMPIDTFKKIIDESIDMGFSGWVNLQHFNEPLLDERLEDFASYAKNKPEVENVWAFSNMDLITEERAKNLDGLLDGITVALYMPKEKQAEREKWLESLFKYTRLDFTKGIHFTTHYSPWSNLNEHIEEQKNKPCTSYNHMLIIAYDGTVLHCCDDYVGHFGLGNVNTKSVKDIWQSEEHKKLVHDLRSSGGRLKYKYCSECPR